MCVQVLAHVRVYVVYRQVSYILQAAIGGKRFRVSAACGCGCGCGRGRVAAVGCGRGLRSAVAAALAVVQLYALLCGCKE